MEMNFYQQVGSDSVTDFIATAKRGVIAGSTRTSSDADEA